MKVLIIGGTGNISRWIVPKLHELGHDVTLFNRGRQITRFEQQCTVLFGDRTDYPAFESKVKDAGTFDCVIDMIGYEPADAESAVRVFSGRVGQYIFCSTIDVFEKSPVAYPLNEDSKVAPSPSFQYAYKKAQMEKILQRAKVEKNFPLTILRPAATYSEGWSPLVTCFGGGSYHLDRLRRGKPVILHGDGSAIWVATHSYDVAKAFVAAVGNSKALGETYNVTGDEWMTWQSMHRVVAEELHAPSPAFVFIPTEILVALAPVEAEWCKENFQFNNLYDNSRAKRDLNFTYTISFAEGARRCIRHLMENELIENSDNYPFYDSVLARWSSFQHNLMSR